jgi:hypothetical protein
VGLFIGTAFRASHPDDNYSETYPDINYIALGVHRENVVEWLSTALDAWVDIEKTIESRDTYIRLRRVFVGASGIFATCVTEDADC